MAPVHVTFRGWRCRVERASYGGTDRIALPLTNVEDGSPVAMATVNLPELHLAANEVLIKDYSENEGMLALLVGAGVVSPPLREVQLRYVTLYGVIGFFPGKVPLRRETDIPRSEAAKATFL